MPTEIIEIKNALEAILLSNLDLHKVIQQMSKELGRIWSYLPITQKDLKELVKSDVIRALLQLHFRLSQRIFQKRSNMGRQIKS